MFHQKTVYPLTRKGIATDHTNVILYSFIISKYEN